MNKFSQLRKVYRLAENHFYNKHKTRLWLRTINPILDPNLSRSPLEMIRQNQGQKVIHALEAANRRDHIIEVPPIKPGDVVVWDERNFYKDFWKNLSEEDRVKYYGWTGYPNKKRLFVYLTDINSISDSERSFSHHCVLVALDDQSVETMRHPSEFRHASEEEF